MILTLVNRPHQSRSDEAEIMSHSARWSIYISITTRTRLKWPQMADVIDHTRQYCNTTWENKQEKWIPSADFSIQMFWNISCHIVREAAEHMARSYFLQACAKTVTGLRRRQDKFSGRPENNDQAPELSGPGEVVLAFPVDFLYEINSFMAIGV